MKMFAGPATLKALSVLGMREGDAIEAPMLTRAVARAQKKVEERNFQMRKSILEYDEPLNVQRGKFYGLRQRILEGKDLRSIVLESIDSSVTDAVATYLDPLHAPRCVSEWVWEHYGVHVEPERFRGKDRDGMLRAVKTDTHEEALASIDTALNEFLPDEDAEHLDPALLREWAQKTWACELTEAQVSGGRREVRAALESAMRARFDAIDTAALEPMVAGDWSRSELARWCSAKWNRPVTVADLGGSPDAKEVTATLQRLARTIYGDREVSFAIDAWVERTGAMLAAQQPEALEHFCAWARERHGVDWTPATLPSSDPREIRERLVAIVRERASTDPKHREELSMFEQMVLVQVLDATWKDHLHAMDQLRDSIGFRSFSQKDPRIEFKRESSRLYAEMELAARDRVTDLVFKGRLQLAMPRPTAPAPQAAQEAPSNQPPAPLPAAPRKPVDGAAIVGRNEPCPCGSGKKYGKCCGARQKAEA
jgi:preprotein translocase subunit SecA